MQCSLYPFTIAPVIAIATERYAESKVLQVLGFQSLLKDVVGA